MASKASSRFQTGIQGHIQLQRLAQGVNDTASKIGNAAANLHTELAALEIELKADEAGLVELKANLGRIRLEKQHAETRLRRNRETSKRYDAQIGPFDKIYNANVAAIGTLYDAAKEKHAKGINLLVEKFDYHPGFSKGRPGEFRGQPFRPK